MVVGYQLDGITNYLPESYPRMSTGIIHRRSNREHDQELGQMLPRLSKNHFRVCFTLDRVLFSNLGYRES